MTGTTADASVISDDLSLALDVSSLFGQDEEYRDVAFFEGGLFHLVENPFDASHALEPIPVVKVPCSSCQCYCSSNVSGNSNTATDTSMADLNDPLLVDGLLSL